MMQRKDYKYKCGIEISVFYDDNGKPVRWVFDGSHFGFPLRMYGNYDDIMDTEDPKKGKEFFALAAKLNGRSNYVNSLLG